jgi:hypothetical protein
MCWAAAHGVVSLQNVRGDDRWVDWRDARATAYKLLDATLRGFVCKDAGASRTSAPRAAGKKKGSSRS